MQNGVVARVDNGGDVMSRHNLYEATKKTSSPNAACKYTDHAVERNYLAWTIYDQRQLLDLIALCAKPLSLASLAKDPAQRERVASILAQCLESVRIASLLLEAFLPQKMCEFAALLGVSGDTSWDVRSRWGALKPGCPVTKVALYPRVESDKS